MVNCSFSLGPFILESSKQSCVATVALSGENEAFHFTKQVDGCLTTKLVFCHWFSWVLLLSSFSFFLFPWCALSWFSGVGATCLALNLGPLSMTVRWRSGCFYYSSAEIPELPAALAPQNVVLFVRRTHLKSLSARCKVFSRAWLIQKFPLCDRTGAIKRCSLYFSWSSICFTQKCFENFVLSLGIELQIHTTCPWDNIS